MIRDLPKLYSEEQLAAELAVHPETLARERRRGRLGFTRIGHKIRYTAAHVEQYLKDRECASTSKPETASGTSAGRTPMAPQVASQLAREIAGKRTGSTRGTS